MAVGWPAKLYADGVGLRAPRMRDAGAWSALRLANEDWLLPWDGRPPGGPATSWQDRNSPAAYGAALRVWRREAKVGRMLPFAITYDGELVGELNVQNVVLGAFRSAAVGYWVSEHVAGRGVTPLAVALAIDHVFGVVGLHRVEASIRPENTRSRRVVEKLGFREEGLHPRYLFIDGEWRDHVTYALTTEDVPGGALVAYRARQRA
jgi:[ribosomal protein S5]-alanine N-acetyltransferase